MFQIFQFNTRFRLVTTTLCLQPLFVAPLETTKKPRVFKKRGPKTVDGFFHAQAQPRGRRCRTIGHVNVNVHVWKKKRFTGAPGDGEGANWGSFGENFQVRRG